MVKLEVLLAEIRACRVCEAALPLDPKPVLRASATAKRLIVGRILWLPRAQAKQHPDLNCAYAFSISDLLPQVLNELREALESNGFTTAEAERIITPMPQGTLPLGMQPKTVQFAPGKVRVRGHLTCLSTRGSSAKKTRRSRQGDFSVISRMAKQVA